MRHETFVILSCIIVIALCAYIMYLTYELHKAEDRCARMYTSLLHIRSSIHNFNRHYPTLYTMHDSFFTNLLKYTHIF